MFFSEGRAADLGKVFRQENIPCRFSAGSVATGKSVRGDESPMTACGGNFIGDEISRKGAISP
jgi:hypothetical protein